MLTAPGIVQAPPTFSAFTTTVKPAQDEQFFYFLPGTAHVFYESSNQGVSITGANANQKFTIVRKLELRRAVGGGSPTSVAADNKTGEITCDAMGKFTYLAHDTGILTADEHWTQGSFSLESWAGITDEADPSVNFDTHSDKHDFTVTML